MVALRLFQERKEEKRAAGPSRQERHLFTGKAKKLGHMKLRFDNFALAKGGGGREGVGKGAIMRIQARIIRRAIL